MRRPPPSRVQHVVDALKRGRPGGRDRAGSSRSSPWGRSDLFRGHRDVLGVEAGLGVGEAVGVDLVADPRAASGTRRGDGARRRAQDEGKRRRRRPPPACRVPASRPDPRRVQFDQHLVSVEDRVPGARGSTAPRVRRSGRSTAARMVFGMAARTASENHLHGNAPSGGELGEPQGRACWRDDDLTAQNGYRGGSCWTLIQCTVVNSSIAHRPLYRPRPLFFSPPKGLLGRSWTGESLT